jgi:hypothetical protein
MYRTGTSHYRPPLIAKLNATGARFCSSVGEVTFWAETNFALGQVKFEMLRHSTATTSSMTTIKRHSEWSRPYRLPMGKMTPGLYTIRAHSENDPLQNKTATFVVDSC